MFEQECDILIEIIGKYEFVVWMDKKYEGRLTDISGVTFVFHDMSSYSAYIDHRFNVHRVAELFINKLPKGLTVWIKDAHFASGLSQEKRLTKTRSPLDFSL